MAPFILIGLLLVGKFYLSRIRKRWVYAHAKFGRQSACFWPCSPSYILLSLFWWRLLLIFAWGQLFFIDEVTFFYVSSLLGFFFAVITRPNCSLDRRTKMCPRIGVPWIKNDYNWISLPVSTKVKTNRL